jgi:hypothetical protein
MFLLEVVEPGGSARAPPEHTEGGAVGSKDFSPDSVGWGTSGEAAGHRPLKQRPGIKRSELEVMAPVVKNI